MPEERPAEELATELARCQEEAKALAYAVSHDLRQPLRTILHNLQFFERRAGQDLPPEHAQFIERALAAALHGQSMIEDLLTYSRLNTRSKPPEQVDAQALVDRVLREKRGLIEETGGSVVVDKMPTVIVERHQFYLLLYNLISNALIFRDPERSPHVHIKADITKTHWVFSVSDNGLGLPADQWERACQLYKQLHPVGEYPGNGCGLAICSKIVELHGGEISLAAHPGPGTTVRFSLRRPAGPVEPPEPAKIHIRRVGER